MTPSMIVGSLMLVPEAAKLCRVSNETVREWIESGYLVASNVAKAERPSYRIHPDDLHALLVYRQVPIPNAFRDRPQLIVKGLLPIDRRHVVSSPAADTVNRRLRPFRHGNKRPLE